MPGSRTRKFSLFVLQFLPLIYFILVFFVIVSGFVIYFHGYKCQPLFLTPYITYGQLEKARQAAKVSPPLLDNITSFSGFFTVDDENNRNLFFWYFPAENSSGNTPVVLWLQGGPGDSSMSALLMQHGPFALNQDGSLAKRTCRWSKNFHMLYIDSPVGTGFSFAKDKKFLNNRDQVAVDLHHALKQFFTMFPKLAKEEFFISGESYAGFYIPALGRRIHQENQIESVKINMKGVLIGNGLIDLDFEKYGNYLVELKLIAPQDLPDWLEMEEELREAIRQRNQQRLLLALAEITAHLRGIGINSYNYRKKERGKAAEDRLLKRFLSTAKVRSRLHVGITEFKPYEENGVWEEFYRGDLLGKTSPYTEELLENYRVLHYNGDLDVLIHYKMMEEYADSLQWSGAEEYRMAPNSTWRVAGELAGYFKTGGNLTVVVVKDAGHSVPMDQPERALDLVTKFIRNQSLSD